jgi:NAD(P) transhydrogenase subunit beta
MCKAMNRSFFSVILGGFGAAEGARRAAARRRACARARPTTSPSCSATPRASSSSPATGLAVARAQHAVKEMAHKLSAKGVNVRYAIHPVAGRMPGHMNVLLAEAEVPYDQVAEMEDINSDFGTTDVAFVLGANDVVNPLAETPGSPIYGMPILEAHKARTVIVNKRSMASATPASTTRSSTWTAR